MSDVARVTAFLTEEEVSNLITALAGWGGSDELFRKLLSLEDLAISNPGCTFRLVAEVAK